MGQLKYIILFLITVNYTLFFGQTNTKIIDIILVPNDSEYSCGEINKWNSGVIQSVIDNEDGGYELKIKLDSGVRLNYEMCTYGDACQDIPHVDRSWIPYAAVVGKKIEFKVMSCGSGGFLHLTRIRFTP